MVIGYDTGWQGLMTADEEFLQHWQYLSQNIWHPMVYQHFLMVQKHWHPTEWKSESVYNLPNNWRCLYASKKFFNPNAPVACLPFTGIVLLDSVLARGCFASFKPLSWCGRRGGNYWSFERPFRGFVGHQRVSCAKTIWEYKRFISARRKGVSFFYTV